MSLHNTAISSKLLLVEDEEGLGEGILFNLQQEGYTVDWARDGQQALDFFSTDRPDLIVLDIMLPKIDGFEVARRIRRESPQLPILMLTARTALEDRLHGFELGADDYMTKPFHLDELLARIRGMLRRKQWYTEATQQSEVFRFGKNEINFSDLSCHTAERTFQLTAHEAMVMKYLIQNRGKIISRAELLENVWNITSSVETRTVDNFIARLRKYFEPDTRHPVYIRSIRSKGYIFRAESD